MSSSHCLGPICFVPLDASAPKFFGFSEFLVGLALMVLAWTIADVRYRFRVRIAPLPLQRMTFTVVAAVGVFTLLTDLWRAESWLFPQGNMLAIWQAILGGGFLLTFLTWAWFAFIQPPVYGTLNAKRYARTLFRVILKGDPSELAVIADEFTRSAKSLVRYAPEIEEFRSLQGPGAGENKPQKKPPKVTAYANDILLLIGDRRFCRTVVASSPGTAWALFREIRETEKYRLGINTFGKNIVSAALMNRDSFLFQESEGYESGLIGYLKPLSQAMFSNYRMVEAIGTLLDPDLDEKWDAAQWKAYCRVVLIAFRNYAENWFWDHPYALYRAKGYIERAASDLYKLNGVASAPYDDDTQARLRVIVKFIKDAVEILDNKGVPEGVHLRLRKKRGRENFYDYLAEMIFKIILSASTVRSPEDLCWWVQHNTVWHELFNFGQLEGAAGRIVKFKVRRLIYDEVAQMSSFPNFKGSTILGFCLNVMGLTPGDKRYDRDSRALQKAILSWTKKHYAWLHSYNPRVAEACLVDGITYDAEKLRLVKTRSADALRRAPECVYFDVDQPPSGFGTPSDRSESQHAPPGSGAD